MDGLIEVYQFSSTWNCLMRTPVDEVITFEENHAFVM